MGATKIHEALAWLFDTLVMIERAQLIDVHVGRGNDDGVRMVWTRAAWWQWIVDGRPYCSDIVPTVPRQ